MSVICSALIVILLCPVCSFAEEAYDLPIDTNERYTDIVDSDDGGSFGVTTEKSPARAIYITVLSVLLAASVAVLVVTLVKGKKEKEKLENEIKEAENEEIRKIVNEYREKKAQRDELEKQINDENSK